jgi:hypothetical protein
MQSVVLNTCRSQACNFSRVIPEIDIWRAARLMLKRYGDKALEAGGTLENAQAMAAHESPRTTKLYERTGDEITLDEVERITI